MASAVRHESNGMRADERPRADFSGLEASGPDARDRRPFAREIQPKKAEITLSATP